MADIEVITETECEGGWFFEISVREADAATERRCRLRLSWVDYEFWSGGRDAPSKVAAAVVRYLVEAHSDAALPASLDASTARRLHPEIDDHLSELIQ